MKVYTTHISKNSSWYKINKLSNCLNNQRKQEKWPKKIQKIPGQPKKVTFALTEGCIEVQL